jgi:pimeloyl-ACP methyl ester carboxylesterase
MGVSEGGPLCSLFAATYPRTEAPVMVGCYARRMVRVSVGATRDERDRFCRTIIDQWAGPSDSTSARRRWLAIRVSRVVGVVSADGSQPGAAVALTRMNAEIDIRDVLPSIRVPTLVLHRTGDRCLRVEEGRYLASRIPGAIFVVLHVSPSQASSWFSWLAPPSSTASGVEKPMPPLADAAANTRAVPRLVSPASQAT